MAGWSHVLGWPEPYIYVYTHCIFGNFQAKNTVCTPYIYIYIYMVLANPSHVCAVLTHERCMDVSMCNGHVHTKYISPSVYIAIRIYICVTHARC